jgi:hypothetical protein
MGVRGGGWGTFTYTRLLTARGLDLADNTEPGAKADLDWIANLRGTAKVGAGYTTWLVKLIPVL